MPLTVSPTSVDLYKRLMVEMFDQRDFIGIPTMFQSIFGRSQTGAKTVYQKEGLTVEIDIIKGNERLGQLVKRGTYAAVLQNHEDALQERFTNQIYNFPLAQEETPVHAHQLFFRKAGETPYQAKSRWERMRELMSEGHKEQVRRLGRMMEWLAAQSIITGKQPYLSGTTEGQNDYKRASDNFITTSTAWSDASADVLGDLDDACVKVRENGHIEAEFAIMGVTAFEGALNNTAIKSLSDNRKLDQTRVYFDPATESKYGYLAAGGAKYRGELQTASGYVLKIFTYNEGYTDASGNFVRYMADDQVVVGSTLARADRYFGPSERLPATPSEAALFSELFGFSPSAPPMPDRIANTSAVMTADMFDLDMYLSERKTVATVRTTTAPIYATTHTDAWAVIDTTP